MGLMAKARISNVPTPEGAQLSCRVVVTTAEIIPFDGQHVAEVRQRVSRRIDLAAFTIGPNHRHSANSKSATLSDDKQLNVKRGNARPMERTVQVGVEQ